MSGKWKYFVKKYQNFCIVSGIAGFLLAPFLWPFFLAILVNTLSLTVPVLLVYLLVCHLKKKPKEVKGETFTEHKERDKPKVTVTEEVPEKKEAPIYQKAKQQIEKAIETEKNPETIPDVRQEQWNEADIAAKKWYLGEGREKFFHISKKLEAKGIYSFSIGKDGLCTIRTEKGFRRVAAIRDFPADKRILIKKELEKDGGYSVKISGRYMWITRR